MTCVRYSATACVNATEPSAIGAWSLLCVQIILTVIVMTCLFLAPPAYGPMRIVPLPLGKAPTTWLDGSFDWRLISVASEGGGSMVVLAKRSELLLRALMHGSIVISAVPVLCGPKTREATL
jgi:hypothetical protein